MFLKNNAARLITLAVVVDGSVKDFQILPGENPAVEVPDSASELDFVVAQIANGSLIEVVAPKTEEPAKRGRKAKEETEE